MNNKYMIDTDICSYIIKDNLESVRNNLIAHQDDDICISLITYAELKFGVLKKKSKKLEDKLKSFIELVRIVMLNEAAVECYIQIRQLLESAGTPLDDFDMLIAACAINENAVL
ncbi:MAG: type II toxin-antitoxin system VapC family toxin, partial [Elusimicrobiota bacterium]|nr:type II toxin-antitoxin system VapC family toxin [Elusimicrobiota bacterium]